MNALRRTLIASPLLLTALALQAQTVGQPAPAFSAVDASGKTVTLADYKGRTVVLEWANPGCPFVKKHYGAGNMQGTQKAAVADGVVWLTVSSSHPGSADHRKPADLAAWLQAQGGAGLALSDDSGANGRAWGAKTTPHLFIVDKAGVLAYAGAIDSIASANPADIARATNYVSQALAEIKAGKPVSKPSSAPYGCSVKYG